MYPDNNIHYRYTENEQTGYTGTSGGEVSHEQIFKILINKNNVHE